MTSILGRIFSRRANGVAKPDTYHRAMAAADRLIEQLKAPPSDAVRETVSSLIAHRGNVPYVVTLFEASQEMNAAVKQRR